MKALAYYDGKIGTPEELTVPFNDRVHFFGDGCYDATVGANGKVYLLQDHLDRFYTSARLLDIHIPMEKEALGELLTRLLGMVDSVVAALNRLGDFVPAGVLTTGEGLAESLSNWLRGLDISGWLTSLAGRAPSLVSGVSSFAISTVVFIMASYFITSDYPRLRFLLTDRVPADTRTFCGTVKRIFMEAFGGYLKSQLLLSLGVFVILAVGFLIIRQPYGLLLAAGFALCLIYVVDAGYNPFLYFRF